MPAAAEVDVFDTKISRHQQMTVRRDPENSAVISDTVDHVLMAGFDRQPPD
jgi:hypothetical protein